EYELLVDREVRRHACARRRRWSRQSGGGGPHIGAGVGGVGAGIGGATQGLGTAHRSLTVGRGAGMGSKSLNRRTRLPRRMHSTAASPSPSSRLVVDSDAPCSESGPSWLRIRSVAIRRATVSAETVWRISSPGLPARYMEVVPSVRYWVTQLAHTP